MSTNRTLARAPKIDKYENLPIKCFGSYIPIKNIKCIDKGQDIWVGDRIVELGTPDNALLKVYFTMRDSKTDIDKLFPIFELTDESILGTKFWCVPKEKLLFSCDEPTSTIIRAPIERPKPGVFS